MADGSPAPSVLPLPAANSAHNRRRLFVTSAFTERKILSNLGKAAYSYRVVMNAFRPLLERWAPTVEVENPHRDLDRMMQRAKRDGLEPLHLSFLPPHLMPISKVAPNIGVPAWEYPDIPATDLGGNPLHNWAVRVERLAAIITHTNFSRDAFLRAKVSPPVHVVPVPVADRYLNTPDWEPGQKVRLAVPCYDFPTDSRWSPTEVERWSGAPIPDPDIDQDVPGFIGAYRRRVKPHLPSAVRWGVNATRRASIAIRNPRLPRILRRTGHPIPPVDGVDLEGVVYTTIFNHLDGRKNWHDLIAGFVTALQTCPDATLVVKLIVRPESALVAAHNVIGSYLGIAVPHRCRVVIVTAFLNDAAMAELTRASTYYVNVSKAEGSCLPLQDFLAAGRPAIAPAHTGMADSLNPTNGFLPETHAQPACFPQDPYWWTRTTDQRLVWPSYCMRLQESYRVAKSDSNQFARKSEAARQRMRDLVGRDAVWPALRAALDDAYARSRALPDLPARRAA